MKLVHNFNSHVPGLGLIVGAQQLWYHGRRHLLLPVGAAQGTVGTSRDVTDLASSS